MGSKYFSSFTTKKVVNSVSFRNLDFSKDSLQCVYIFYFLFVSMTLSGQIYQFTFILLLYVHIYMFMFVMYCDLHALFHSAHIFKVCNSVICTNSFKI